MKLFGDTFAIISWLALRYQTIPLAVAGIFEYAKLPVWVTVRKLHRSSQLFRQTFEWRLELGPHPRDFTVYFLWNPSCEMHVFGGIPLTGLAAVQYARKIRDGGLHTCHTVHKLTQLGKCIWF